MASKKQVFSDAVVTAVDIVGRSAGFGLAIDLSSLFEKLTELFAERDKSSHPESSPIGKLEIAASHIRDALAAVDALKLEYTAQEQRLQHLSNEASEKQHELEELLKDHYLAAKLKREDQAALRAVLGVADIEMALRKGKLSGFATGVLASLIASVLFVGVPWVYHQLHQRMATQESNQHAPSALPGQGRVK